MRAHLVVEVDPGTNDAFGVEPVPEFVEVHRLVLQRPPQPLDEEMPQQMPDRGPDRDRGGGLER